MRITIEPTEGPYDFEGSDQAEFEHPKAVIELKNDDLDITDVMEYLVKPALKGFGFLERTVEEIGVPEKPTFESCIHYLNELSRQREA